MKDILVKLIYESCEKKFKEMTKEEGIKDGKTKEGKIKEQFNCCRPYTRNHKRCYGIIGY